MSDRLQLQKRLFSEFYQDNAEAMIDVLEAMRPELYDYLMNMCGQKPRSMETIDEVYRALLSDYEREFKDFEDFKVCVFKTARSFTADIWGAETQSLINAAVSQSESPLSVADATEIYTGMTKLQSEPRECFLLVLCYQLSTEAAASVIGITESAVKKSLESGKKAIKSTDEYTSLPLHPLPVSSVQSSRALSMIVSDIKKARKNHISLKVVLLLIIAAGVLGYYFNENSDELVDVYKEKIVPALDK